MPVDRAEAPALSMAVNLNGEDDRGDQQQRSAGDMGHGGDHHAGQRYRRRRLQSTRVM